jgi:putative transposase
MPVTITDLRDTRTAISTAAIAYLTTERDLFSRWGPTAVRHIDDDDRRRLARLAHDLGWRRAQRHTRIATTATLRRWWRDLIAAQPTSQRGGRKPISPEHVVLILAMARDNSLGNDAWGRRRICGELKGLGITISASTIRRVLQRHGIPPAPQRGRAWDGPVAAAASDPNTVAIDFTQVIVGHGDTATSYYLLAGIHLGSREVEILGLTQHPDSAWVAQVARNMTMDEVGFLHRVGATTVLMDRDKLFTLQFRHMIGQAEFAVARTPPECPWCNGFIERFWSTLKNGIVRKAIWLDEDALRQAVVAFTHDHYLTQRPHQGLGNLPPKPSAEQPDTSKPVVRHDLFGGLIHVYRRAA